MNYSYNFKAYGYVLPIPPMAAAMGLKSPAQILANCSKMFSSNSAMGDLEAWFNSLALATNLAASSVHQGLGKLPNSCKKKD